MKDFMTSFQKSRGSHIRAVGARGSFFHFQLWIFNLSYE